MSLPVIFSCCRWCVAQTGPKEAPIRLLATIYAFMSTTHFPAKLTSEYNTPCKLQYLRKLQLGCSCVKRGDLHIISKPRSQKRGCLLFDKGKC
ncbi:hypothetical protein BofuT4_uP065120.1 [Botrytis cinerea T4]|uniref:Uncharacterized protein n=1 Tax=Botryotinia fuckeliana (strain T4) TaxID=999810 RepID=G2XSN3_BOTF4|nr:hypothetical protein BofuT4_uP065120.1 [Botrytis cinerea T4]